MAIRTSSDLTGSSGMYLWASDIIVRCCTVALVLRRRTACLKPITSWASGGQPLPWSAIYLTSSPYLAHLYLRIRAKRPLDMIIVLSSVSPWTSGDVCPTTSFLTETLKPSSETLDVIVGPRAVRKVVLNCQAKCPNLATAQIPYPARPDAAMRGCWGGRHDIISP